MEVRHSERDIMDEYPPKTQYEKVRRNHITRMATGAPPVLYSISGIHGFVS
jgi:hypothetical protein